MLTFHQRLSFCILGKIRSRDYHRLSIGRSCNHVSEWNRDGLISERRFNPLQSVRRKCRAVLAGNDDIRTVVSESDRNFACTSTYRFIIAVATAAATTIASRADAARPRATLPRAITSARTWIECGASPVASQLR